MIGTRQQRAILAQQVCDLLMRRRMRVDFIVRIFGEELGDHGVPFLRHLLA